jgi:hypothetical protein
MSITEMLYTLAYCVFLAGAAKSFREQGSRASVLLMSAGVLIDFLVSMLPLAGVQALKMNLEGTNAVITFAIALGFVVWLLFFTALFLRYKGRMGWYHGLITAVEICWFIDFIAFLYGSYVIPLYGGPS